MRPRSSKRDTTPGRAFGLAGWLALIAPCVPCAALGQEPAPQTTASPSSTPALHWTRAVGAEDCVAGAQLTREVEGKLGRPLPNAREAAVSIEGHVERSGDEYRAQLRMIGADGAQLGLRELSSAQRTCAELSETLVIVLALMIDPEGASQSAPPAVVPTPPTPPPAAPPSPPSAPPVQRVERPRKQLLLGLARVGFNMLHEPTVGLGGAYEITLGKAGALRAEALTFVEQDTRFSPGNSGLRPGAKLHVAYAGLAYCPVFLPLWRARVAGCLGAELGRMRSQGHGFLSDRTKDMAWVSGSLAARVTLPLLNALALQLGVGVALPRQLTYRATLAQSDGTTRKALLFEVGQPGVTLDAAVGARF